MATGKTISYQEWQDSRKERGVPLLIYLHTEVMERLLFNKGVFKNNEEDSEKALKCMDESIKNGNFQFKSVHVDYESLIPKIEHITQRIL